MLLRPGPARPSSCKHSRGGRPAGAHSSSSCSRPRTMLSSRCSRRYQPLMRLLAWVEATKESQSRLGRDAGAEGGDDLHHVAVLEHVVQRHHARVDLRADAVVADLGVDAVGEVDGRRTGREIDHVALRREDEDLVLEEVDLERLQPLVRIAEVAVEVEQLAQPGELGLDFDVAAVALLVAPVRGDAVLRAAVHGPGADLHLHRLPVRADHLGVQGLVHVGLGLGDVVGEHVREGDPERVHHAEGGVALRLRVHDDADGLQVEDLAEVHALSSASCGRCCRSALGGR